MQLFTQSTENSQKVSLSANLSDDQFTAAMIAHIKDKFKDMLTDEDLKDLDSGEDGLKKVSNKFLSQYKKIVH